MMIRSSACCINCAINGAPSKQLGTRPLVKILSHPFAALEDIIETGCERILTSGLVPSCLDGAPLIAQLIQQADERIIIMPGSGLRASNVIDVAKITGAGEFHTSARINIDSMMHFTNKAMKENLQTVLVDEEEVKKIIANLKGV